MASRLELQTRLEELLGSPNVYYQPPASIHMEYPAIVYSRQNIDNVYANDGVYVQTDVYEVVVIDKNPDSEFVKKLARLSYARYDRHYTADNLNHDVFTLYF